MAEEESYVTKDKPSEQDWLEYNEGLFAILQHRPTEAPIRYAPFVDVDKHAEQAGVETEAYFEAIKKQVGDLGTLALKLVHSEMDNAHHIALVGRDETNE